MIINKSETIKKEERKKGVRVKRINFYNKNQKLSYNDNRDKVIRKILIRCQGFFY